MRDRALLEGLGLRGLLWVYAMCLEQLGCRKNRRQLGAFGNDSRGMCGDYEALFKDTYGKKR